MKVLRVLACSGGLVALSFVLWGCPRPAPSVATRGESVTDYVVASEAAQGVPEAGTGIAALAFAVVGIGVAKCCDRGSGRY